MQLTPIGSLFSAVLISLLFSSASSAAVLQGGSADLTFGGGVSRGANGPISLQLTIDTVAEEVDITITGPATYWFGVGFDPTGLGMFGGPYVIVASDIGVFEQDLGTFSPGGLAPVGISNVTDTLTGSRRTFTLSRALNAIYTECDNPCGFDPDPFSFPTVAGLLSLVWATGTGENFMQHGSSGAGFAGRSSIELTAVPIPVALMMFLPALGGLLFSGSRTRNC